MVQDIPLLVETGQGSSFHLVLVVDAPDEVRIQRMVEFRRMSRDDALARMASQATRAERNAAADVVLTNSGSREELLTAVEALWERRLIPFAENLSRGGTRASRKDGPPVMSRSKGGSGGGPGRAARGAGSRCRSPTTSLQWTISAPRRYRAWRQRT